MPAKLPQDPPNCLAKRGGRRRRGCSAPKVLVDLEPADLGVQLLVAGMRVSNRRDRVRMPSEPLGQEEILRGPVDVRDGRVPQRVEVVDPLESRDLLPVDEGRAEFRRSGTENLRTTRPTLEAGFAWRGQTLARRCDF
jgi:hypothetical protein